MLTICVNSMNAVVAMERAGELTNDEEEHAIGVEHQTEGFIGVLAAGSFFGEIGPHNYGISARIVGGLEETIIFSLDKVTIRCCFLLCDHPITFCVDRMLWNVSKSHFQMILMPHV
jgi:hypothetical protein